MATSVPPPSSCRAFERIASITVGSRPTGGHPMLRRLLHAEGRRRSRLRHYDVQPVDPLDLWTRPPFDPVVEGGRVWARGAADDKSHVHAHIWAARAWLETRGKLPVNLKIVMEGEEESGSENFDAWIVANREKLGPTSR